MTKLTSQEIGTIAEEAYVYAFPMMMGYRFGAQIQQGHRIRRIRVGRDHILEGVIKRGRFPVEGVGRPSIWLGPCSIAQAPSGI